jgi:hypothetical protein
MFVIFGGVLRPIIISASFVLTYLMSAWLNFPACFAASLRPNRFARAAAALERSPE